jgi:hypothetical protein
LTTSAAPSRAIDSASARPIPRPAPVTRPTMPPSITNVLQGSDS